MNDRQLDIDWIVAEVVRRLRSAAPLPPRTAAAKPAADTGSSLALGDRVVTLAQLEGRGHDFRQLVVAANAIVTPAVRDELASREIELIYRECPANTSQRTAARCVAVADDRAARDRFHDWFGNLGSEWELSCAASNREAVDSAVAAVRQRRPAAIWTSAAAEAVCLANREVGVWAAAGGDSPATADAMRQVDVNLLVIDNRQHSRGEQRASLQTFLSHFRSLSANSL